MEPILNFNQQKQPFWKWPWFHQGLTCHFSFKVYEMCMNPSDKSLFLNARSDWKMATFVTKSLPISCGNSPILSLGTGNLTFILLKLIRKAIVEKPAWTHAPCRSFWRKNIAVPCTKQNLWDIKEVHWYYASKPNNPNW